MSGRDKNFDGSYDTSRYANRSLERDIMEAGRGRIVGEMPGGGLYKQSDDRIDAWTPGKPGDYRHDYYNMKTNEVGSKEGKR